MMDIEQYLKRINYKGAIEKTHAGLAQLQRAHLQNVPFENLDIYNHIKIDTGNLFEKIVVQRRGGFCYELNGLFYQLLKEIGFTAKMVSARVYNAETKQYSPEFDHMAIIVLIRRSQYLVDVGFGEFASSPISMIEGEETVDPRGVFKIGVFDESYKIVKKKNKEGNFMPEYIFSEKERQMEEFYARCEYHQTNPQSHFLQKRICSLPTNTGRITLTGNTLKITEGGLATEKELHNEEEVQEVLWNYFGIKLSAL